MTPLERITERVTRLGHPDSPDVPRPLLTLKEFFDGNDVVGSIGCNLEGSPAPARIHELLKEIAERPEVEDVRVQITLFDEPTWPFSDTVFIMTSASPEVVESWFPENLRPDDMGVGFPEGVAFEPYEKPPGTAAILCWWD